MPIFWRNTRVADDPTNRLSEYPVPQLQIINDYFSSSLGNQMCVSVVYNQGETPARIMSSRLVFHLKLTKTLNSNTSCWILLLTRSAWLSQPCHYWGVTSLTYHTITVVQIRILFQWNKWVKSIILNWAVSAVYCSNMNHPMLSPFSVNTETILYGDKRETIIFIVTFEYRARHPPPVIRQQ